MWDSHAAEPGAAIDEIFRPAGLLDRSLADYEFRPSQLAMAHAVLDSIHHRKHLCVEAGTGTGKTLAYLIPALFSDKRVVISTATKNLQDQIVYKDIPFLKSHLHAGIAATCMKGRQNYICLKKFRDLGEQGTLLEAARMDRMRLEDWVAGTETGDRAELDWLADDDPVWRTLDARSDTCAGVKCPLYEECFITRMRRKAQESDVIIVNHALFFANLALKTDEIGQIVPDFGTAILDEAHEIEDIAASHFGRQFSSYQLDELVRDFQRSFQSLPSHAARLSAAWEAGVRFFAACPPVTGKHSLNYFRHPNLGVSDLREVLADEYSAFRASLESLYHPLLAERELPADGESLIRRLDVVRNSLDSIFECDDPDQVYWFERRGRGLFFRITPIHMARVLRSELFDNVDNVVLTSATLSIDGGFDYVRERLGIPDPAELIVPSEFDYAQQTVLYVPRSFPEPRSPAYLDRFVHDVTRILGITRGHAFLLFTSFQQMNAVFERISGTLPYPLLRQGERPKATLLEEFRQRPGAVLLATASFWQGVDVRGDALRAVMIDKLPFQVPTEPVVAARIQHLKQEGQDPFETYSVPEAVITLKQGLGRLIRSRQDRGILAVFDSRLRTRSYGQRFLRSLPNCPLTDNMGTLENFYRARAS